MRTPTTSRYSHTTRTTPTNNETQGDTTMLKKIALTSTFIFASAFSLSTATAVTASQVPTGKITPPTAPAPQGFGCGGRGC
jgi:hypothetical protein